MSSPLSTAWENFMIPEYLFPGKPKAGYTPVKGHLVIRDATLTDGYDRCAANENPTGIIVSINSSNGTITVARFLSGTRIWLEYIGANPALGEKVEAGSTPGLGTVTYTDRDVVEVDATNGVGRVIAFDTTKKIALIEFPFA